MIHMEPFLQNFTYQILFLNSISVTSYNATESMLSYLQSGTAAGHDEINNERKYQRVERYIPAPLRDFFNAILSQCKGPYRWKKPVLEERCNRCDHLETSALLMTIGKELKQRSCSYVLNFLRQHHVLASLQSGFIPGDSTVNQLVDIYNTF